MECYPERGYTKKEDKQPACSQWEREIWTGIESWRKNKRQTNNSGDSEPKRAKTFEREFWLESNDTQGYQEEL